MIFLYGDSHAHNHFKNLYLPFVDKHQNSITMFRIGRDNKIIHFNKRDHDSNSIICLCYGEVDCRCHIQRQINLGRAENDVIYELVSKYFNTIRNNIGIYKKIIIVAVIPPTEKEEYEKINGPITHAFPFVGSDADRVRYTYKMNQLLELFCNKYGMYFFNPFSYYTRDNGCLKHELSDGNVHIAHNYYFLEKFVDTYCV